LEAAKMAVTVKTLYKNGTFLYKMQLLAGKSGLDNIVQWVHIIEDDSVSPFLRGGELVFTAGILNKRDGWLLEFARKLREADASALVVNMGPHTAEIPQDVAEYCDKTSLPLFTIPWETKMVDMTRDFCHRIMRDEHTENTIMTTMKNILFKVGDAESQVLQLERYGFQRNSRFCFIGVQADGEIAADPEEQGKILKTVSEITAKKMSGLFTTFSYNECRVLVLVNYTDAEIGAYLDEFTALAARRLRGVPLHMGVSPNETGIYNQNVNFEKALSALEMAWRKKETFVHYDRLGIYKVLYAVGDKAALRSFYYDTVGKLEKYDQENSTHLTHLLREYLQNNGSLQLVAEKQYIHRNTVTNSLKRIEGITGYNPLDLEDKVKLSMGFYIADIL
jgi:predicted DNA-binding protein YlxM (UPF0122 family)